MQSMVDGVSGESKSLAKRAKLLKYDAKVEFTRGWAESWLRA